MPEKELAQYISSELANGVEPGSIIGVLKTQGWSDQDIEAAFTVARGNQIFSRPTSSSVTSVGDTVAPVEGVENNIAQGSSGVISGPSVSEYRRPFVVSRGLTLLILVVIGMCGWFGYRAYTDSAYEKAKPKLLAYIAQGICEVNENDLVVIRNFEKGFLNEGFVSQQDALAMMNVVRGVFQKAPPTKKMVVTAEKLRLEVGSADFKADSSKADAYISLMMDVGGSKCPSNPIFQNEMTLAFVFGSSLSAISQVQ